MLSSLRNY